jgi:Bacterial membrane protein YfhO
MQPVEFQANREISEPIKNALGIFILFAIAIAFFYPLLFDGKVIFYRDFQFITYPVRYFLAQAYHQGVIPYWTTSTFGGMPFMATLHPGVFYPPSIIFFLNDYPLALNIFYVFHFLIMGWFVFLLGRQWKMSWFAALCCGVTGMLGGSIVASTLCSNYFLSSIWLPMIFWLYYRFEEQSHPGWFVGLVLAIFTQTLAACPEISVMTMLLLYLHAIVFTQKERGKLEYVRITTTLGLAVILALGLAAFQLAPTAALLKHTFRDGGLDFAFHSNWSLSPSKLTTFILTPEYDDFLKTTVKNKYSNFTGLLHTLYMGIFGFLFVALGLLFRSDKAVGFWLVVFLFGVFFALGKYNPVYEIIYRLTPFLDSFRYPEKYFFVSSMAVTFLVGFCLDGLIRATQSRKIKISSVLILFLLIFGSTLTLALFDSNLEPQYPIAFLIIFFFSYVFFYYGKIKRIGFVVLLFIMIVLDLSIKDMHLLPLMDRKFYEEQPLLMDIVGGSAGKHRTYSGHIDKFPNPMAYPTGPNRLASVRAAKQQLYSLQGMVFGIEHVGGIPGLALDIQNHLVWYQYLIQSEADIRRVILKRSNVKFWVDGDSPTYHAEGEFPIILPDRVKIFKDALPRAFLVPKMRVPKKGEILLTYYDKAFDPLKEVLLSKPIEFQESARFNGEVEEVLYSPNHVTVKTRQEGHGFLVLLDTYLPGWTVKVNGQSQEILRANGLYRAVQLGPGKHTLEFEYFPEGFKEGLIVTSVTPVLGLVGYVFWRRRLRRPL